MESINNILICHPINFVTTEELARCETIRTAIYQGWIKSIEHCKITKVPEYDSNMNQLEFATKLVNLLKDINIVIFGVGSDLFYGYRIIKNICVECGIPFYEIA